jgi:OTU-like cysteine protease
LNLKDFKGFPLLLTAIACIGQSVELLLNTVKGLYGHDGNHMELRQYVFRYLKAEKLFFSQFMTIPFDNYVKNLLTDGHWADNIEIQIIAELYDVRVEIYTTSRSPIKVFNEKPQAIKFPLRLFYLQQAHYELIWDSKRSHPLGMHNFGLIETAAVESAESRHSGNSPIPACCRTAFEQLRKDFLTNQKKRMFCKLRRIVCCLSIQIFSEPKLR